MEILDWIQIVKEGLFCFLIAINIVKALVNFRKAALSPAEQPYTKD